MRNLLLEILVVNPATGDLQTLRLSSALAGAEGVYLDGSVWLPALTGEPEISLSYFSEGQFQPASVSYGKIQFIISAELQNTHWPKLDWDGALAAIWVGELGSEFSQYEQIYSGAVGPLTMDGSNSAGVDLLGSEAALNRVWLDRHYAGTGLAEGEYTLLGTPKPRSFGRCVNVDPVLIDTVNWVYQYNAYEATPVHAVYSNALDLGPVHSSYSTFSALVAAALPDGTWASCPALGMFRLANEPNSKITADIGTTATVQSVTRQLLKSAGVHDDFIASSFNDPSSDVRNYSLYRRDGSDTVGDLAREAAYAASRLLISDSAGVFHLAPRRSTKTPTALASNGSTLPTVLPDSITQEPPSAPAWRVRVGHTRVWSVHSSTEISEALTAEAIDNVARQAAEDAQDAADAASAAAGVLQSRLDDTVNDAILDRAEKRYWIAEFEKMTAARSAIIAEATAVGVVSTAYQTAYSTLESYLTGLSPAFTNTGSNTPIVASTFKTNFTNVATQYAALTVALAAKAKTLANWSGIGDRPTDLAALDPTAGTKLTGIQAGATVGAPSGTNIGSQTVDSFLADYNAKAAQIAQARTDVNQLFDIYGDTISANGANSQAQRNAINSTYLDVYQSYDFETGGLNGWISSNATLVAGIGGATVNPTTSDPYHMRTGLSYAGSRYTRILVDVTRIADRTSGGSWDGSLFWSIAGRSWTSGYSARANPDPKLNERTTLTFNMTTSAQAADYLANTITGIRLDLDNAPNSTFKIHSIRIVGSNALQPTINAEIAQTAATNASNSAASAATSERLAASHSNIINTNAGFDDYPSAGGGALPTGWLAWTGVANYYRVADSSGGYAVRIPSPAGSLAGIMTLGTAKNVSNNEYYVLEADVILNSGSLNGAGILFSPVNAAGEYLDLDQKITFATDKDTTNNVVGAGASGKLYRFRKLVRSLNPNAYTYRLWALSHWDGFGSITVANDITFLKVGLRPATDGEISAGVALPNLEATVVSQSSAIATVTGRTASHLNKVGDGVSSAEVEIISTTSGGASTSAVTIVADKLKFRTTSTPVFEASAGRVLISTDLHVQNGKIVVDTGTHMKVSGNGFGTMGQFVEWYGPKMAFNLCSEGNGTFWLKKDGSAYFAGSLSAGVKKNAAQTSLLATNASVVCGPFGNFGNPITVVCSWTYQTQTEQSFAPTAGASFNSLAASYGASGAGSTVEGSVTNSVANSTVTLARKIGTGSFANVQSASTTTESATFYGTRPVSWDEQWGWAYITRKITTTFTYTDTSGGTAGREFMATLARGLTYATGNVTQSLSIITTEN